MTVTDFAASSDLCGRRIDLRWNSVRDSTSAAPVLLRRKEHDFAYPAAEARYVIYNSEAFPPAPVSGKIEVHELPGETGVVEGLRFVERIHTVTAVEQGDRVEVLRRTVRTFTRPDQTVVRQEFELLDAGAGFGPLAPGRTYYYQLEELTDPPNRLRGVATASGVYGYHQLLYDALPQVYRRDDTVARPVDAGTGLIPEAIDARGQLRRLFDVFGSAVGALRSSADGLRALRDITETDARFLPLLAQWIGWEFGSDDIARQRNELAAAPARYRAVGTLGGLCEIASHYTGMSVRIAEPAQNIARSNTPAQRNVFAAVQRTGLSWSGVEDCADLLGLGGASGTDIIGKPGPFRLAEGMSLRVAVDHGVPYLIRFGAQDFRAITTASAAEVAAVIGRAIRSVDASSAAGAVRLRSLRVSTGADVAVSAAPASLVSLDGAATGRLATAVGVPGAGWLGYASTAGPESEPRLLLKARRSGTWYDAQPIGTDIEPQADPALVALDDELWCAWVSEPGTGSRLRFRHGTVAAPAPAMLRGDTVEPFALATGTRIVTAGTTAAQTFTVIPANFANLAAATATEVATAMNAQMTGVTARADSGTLELESDATGPGVILRIDLAKSSAAWALGFGDRDLFGQSSWSPDVEWGRAHDVGQVPTGIHADCTALAESDAAIRLCWSTHIGGIWRLLTSRWSRHLLLSSSSGLTIVTATDGPSTVGVADGLPSEDVRAAVSDADGTVWLATGAGAAARATDGVVTTFTTSTTGGGLPADDVRAVAVGPNGAVWFATAAGVGRRALNGAWVAFDTSDGLPSNDVRAVATVLDGAVWAATAAGVAVREAGAWHTITPIPNARRLAAAADGAMWVATDLAVARVVGTTVLVHELADLAPDTTNVRDIAVDGMTLWIATTAGVVEFRDSHERVLHVVANGIADPDCRAITVSDGEVWVATASGVFSRDATGGWVSRVTAPGSAVALSGSWSAPMMFDQPAAGERDPHLVRDAATLLLAAARRKRSASGDTWQITLRRRAPGTATWSVPVEVTAAGKIDREPTIVARADGSLSIYFRSNRAGGERIWRVEVSPEGVSTDPVAITSGPSVDTDPAVLAVDSTEMLLFRSDRNVVFAPRGGGWVAQEISQRRWAGSGTVVLDDAVRNGGRGSFGDLLDYTPERPRGDAPAAADRYTPGTVAVFFDRGAGQAAEAADAGELRSLLADVVPANVRVVTIANPSE